MTRPAPEFDAATIEVAAESLRQSRAADLLKNLRRRGYSPLTIARALRVLALAADIHARGGPTNRAEEATMAEAGELERPFSEPATLAQTKHHKQESEIE